MVCFVSCLQRAGVVRLQPGLLSAQDMPLVACMRGPEPTHLGTLDGCFACQPTCVLVSMSGRALSSRSIQPSYTPQPRPRFNLPGLWLCQAKCHHGLALLEVGDERKRIVERAVEIYEKVRVQVPGNPDACTALGELYLEQVRSASPQLASPRERSVV